jgi:hypothetical protein
MKSEMPSLFIVFHLGVGRRVLGTDSSGKFHAGSEDGSPSGALMPEYSSPRRKTIYICIFPGFCFMISVTSDTAMSKAETDLRISHQF